MILSMEIYIENIIIDQIGLSFGITCQPQLRNLFNIVPYVARTPLKGQSVGVGHVNG
jgi:hypothetical protein